MLAVMMIKKILTTRVRLMVTIYDDDDDDDVLCPQCKLWQPHTLLP